MGPLMLLHGFLLMDFFKFSPLIVLCLPCSLSVVVEDVSSSACVTVKVFPYMTVAALKQQVRKSAHNQEIYIYIYIHFILIP